jgi:hypothetical protein
VRARRRTNAEFAAEHLARLEEERRRGVVIRELVRRRAEATEAGTGMTP